VCKRSVFHFKIRLMVAMILIICNGNVNIMVTPLTNMTWFEEWFFFFEKIYGKSLSRWWDSMDKYNKNEKLLRKVFDRKLNMLIRSRRNWPTYVTLHLKSRLEKKNTSNWNPVAILVFWDWQKNLFLIAIIFLLDWNKNCFF
jgi:hypothetical protein